MATIAKEHQVWINYLQPEGLVVSSMVLEDAQLALPLDLRDKQLAFHGHLDAPENPQLIVDWNRFAREFLAWPEKYIRTDPDTLGRYSLFLKDYNETLAPTQVLGDKNDIAMVLVQVLPPEMDLDKPDLESRVWVASPKRKMERLLRETGVPIGIQTNRRCITLIYAPRGENAGMLTFPVSFMATVMGRPALGALLLLLGKSQLWSDVADRRLPALLEQSRKAQAKVSTALAQQVLAALYELLRGFSTANTLSKNSLLGDMVKTAPQDIYGGLLTVLMRLVFLLYAEDRGLMPGTDVYESSYSVHGLWAKLRDESIQFPDTMDQRYGAWARLLALFRVVYEGCEHPELKLPSRLGHLFDPERYPFLEGQEEMPAIADGALARILDKLLVLRGEKLSYRTLDVEQIGSVYEAVMGFQFQVVQGLSIAIKPKKAHGAPPILDLEALLLKKPSDRKKTFKELTDRDLNPTALEKLKNAHTANDLLDALVDVQDATATPHPVAAGGWVLQPTDERRRSGSHYTPRSLTQPIVEKALEPIWLRLGEHPQPEEILELNVCDPAMGSGAFLVEACRQIADKLLDSWHHHHCLPNIPPDEDEVLHARRTVAQRCLYGVDRNPMAVDLGKLSLWLATLAKDHPFTFLDHALRCGDSLVGLNRKQIMAFHWDSTLPQGFIRTIMEAKLKSATAIRNRILTANEESYTPDKKAEQLALAEQELGQVRLAGDLIVAAWFGKEKDKEKVIALESTKNAFQWALDKPEGWSALYAQAWELKRGQLPVLPFHWEIEFPEVFAGDVSGFDCFVGNPPFAGHVTVSESNHRNYTDWLRWFYPGSAGKTDVVAFFFRRTFDLLRSDGTLGLVSTNTIAQGDTRISGLMMIVDLGGAIYSVIKRLKWPGDAAVVVSIIHVIKGIIKDIEINRLEVDYISSYLVQARFNGIPSRLSDNVHNCFQGSVLRGKGFIICNDKNGKNTPPSTIDEIIKIEPKTKERIRKFIGGDDINTTIDQAATRKVIYFGDIDYIKASETPLLLEHLKNTVYIERLKSNAKTMNSKIIEEYWKYNHFAKELYARVEGMKSVMALSRVSAHLCISIQPGNQIFGDSCCIFPTASQAFFCILQSRIHEFWARFFASSMKDDLRYTPTDCFETFPFPPGWRTNTTLEAAGLAYYEYRAKLMVATNLGLTKTYNRFHDQEDLKADIVELRRLHGLMDRAVLDAYGWTDIECAYDYYLDYEEDDSDDDGTKRKGKAKKKPWRYRWPDEIRDLLLARLLDLNAKQAAAQGEVLPATAEEDEDFGEDEEGEE